VSRRWLILREGDRRRWGGEIRRAMIFERLAAATGATVVDDWPEFQRHARGRRWQAWRRLAPRPLLAASETAPPRWIPRVAALSEPVAVAVYDDAATQARALGMALAPEREAELVARRRQNEATFRWHVVPTASFAKLVGLDMDRVIVGGNGTISGHVRPGPWPDEPAVGFVSGAAPGRGIETLVEAMRLVREQIAEARLRLWLVATSDAAAAYLDGLRAASIGESWIEIGTAPYERLGEILSTATVLSIPHPANEYMDVALPVKLFDSLAAGRPLVVTPRRETVAIVERHKVGLVAADDSPAAIAAELVRLLADQALAREMGIRAREAAEREFDWSVVGGRIADEVLRREADRAR
jgi:glycosyltransferase involved in cell wall biosynthesis